MQDASEIRRALAAHLDYYRELGIAGISRDPVWRARQARAVPIEVASVVDVPEVAASESPVPESAIPADVPDDMAKARAPHIILNEIRTDIGPACTRCKLHKLGRKQIVFGVGNPKAELMFVGEAPGRDEDEQGEPFVGRAGQLLTKIIEAINLTREEVYIANVIKCRPPENRNPEPDEVATCEPFLFRQVDAIKPKVIVALGTFAAHALLKTDVAISRLRGRTYDYRGAQLICTFHPSYLLRSPERKRDTWEDMKKVRTLLRGEDA
jgi:DNA polymerase